MIKVNGKKVMLARANAGLTLNELSEKCGIARNTISRIEKEKVQARISTLGKIARALGKPVEYFLEK